MKIGGEASLAGTLSPAVTPGKGTAILTAKTIRGTFANPDNQVAAPDGKRFRIVNSPTRVTLAAE